LNVRVLNEGIDFVDSNTSENVKGERCYQEHEKKKNAKIEEVRPRESVHPHAIDVEIPDHHSVHLVNIELKGAVEIFHGVK